MVLATGQFNWQAFGRHHRAAHRDALKIARRRGVHESEVPNKAVSQICEGILSGELSRRDLSIRGVFEAVVPDGREIVMSWRGTQPGRPQGVRMSQIKESVSTSNFANINQAFFTRNLLETFQSPELIASQLVDVIQTNEKFERITGIGELGDTARPVREGDNYPYASLTEDWIETQMTEKRGVIVPVTKEAIFFDKTGLVMTRVNQVNKWLAVNYEKRILDTVLGVVDRYNRKSRGIVATYGDNAGNHDWKNLQTNALVDYESIETADLLFEDVTDPNTGEPVLVGGRQLVVPGALYQTALSILNATEIVRGTQDVADVGFGLQTKGPNPYRSQLPQPLTSPYVKARTSATDSWWYGDFKQAFHYYENWAPEAVTAPPNDQDEFERDIAVKVKISEMGVPAVYQPRAVQKNVASG